MDKLVSLRPAVNSDIDYVYQLRNEPFIRDRAGNSAVIEFEQHQHWYNRKVNDNARTLMLIIEYQGKPAGILRYDVNEIMEAADITIYLEEHYCGKSIGPIAFEKSLAWLRKRFHQVHTIQAHIIASNEGSRYFFSKLGFCAESANIYVKKLI